MPLNCPRAIDGPSCEGCRYTNGHECSYFPFAPEPLSAILTTQERLQQLEATLEQLQMDFAATIPLWALADMRKDLNNIQGMLLHHQKELHKHIDATRPKKKEPKVKGAEI